MSLSFHPITMADQAQMTKFYADHPAQEAQYAFAANFVWRKVYEIQVCYLPNAMLLSFQEGSVRRFRCPLAADQSSFEKAMQELFDFCKMQKIPCLLGGVGQREADRLMRMLPPERLLLEAPEAQKEYLYERQTLVDLPGKKLHPKRTNLRRFLEGNWAYNPMTIDLISACKQMHRAWCLANDCHNNPDQCAETAATMEAFDHFEQLGLLGGVLTLNGQVVAYAMGEQLGGDTFAVHFEKALPQVTGAYAAINQMFCANGMQDATFVNREEDAGVEGLRRAKRSYQPIKLLPLYQGEVLL